MTYRPSFIAPPRWAIQPALTAAPELWRGADHIILHSQTNDLVTRQQSVVPASYVYPALGTRGRSAYMPNQTGTSATGGFNLVPGFGWGKGLAAFTTVFVLDVSSITGSNAGLWRSGGSPRGNNFLIYQGSQTAWVRLAGSDYHLSAPDIAPGFHVIALSVNGANSFYYIDGTAYPFSTTKALDDYIQWYGYEYDISQALNGNYYWDGWYHRGLSKAELDQIWRDPFAMFRPAPRVVGSAPSSTLITLGSAMNSVSAFTGAIDAKPGLAGIAASDFALSAAIDLHQGLTGSIDQASAFTSSLDARPGLTGAMDSVSDLSSNMAMQIGFLSAMASTFALSGNLTLAAQALLLLSGTMASQSAFPNTLGLQLHLQGASDSASTMQSGLSMTQGMVAELAAESGLTGDMSALIGMAGNLDSAMTFDGAVGLLSELIGAMGSDSSWNGDLTLAAYVLGALIAHGINIRAALDAVFDLHPALNADITLQ